MQRLKTTDLHWLAGLLEGEGFFWSQPSGKFSVPALGVGMTDKDVIVKAHGLIRCTSAIYTETKLPPRQPIYRFAITGKRAVQWMMTLYPLFGQRRKAKIKYLLADWKKRPWGRQPNKNKEQPCLRSV